MAVTRASKIISLTNATTGGAFSLSTNKIISYKTSGSNTQITFITQRGKLKTMLVEEAVATIHTATLSNTLYASQKITLTDDAATEIYIMSDRIIYMDAYTSTSGITYDAGNECGVRPVVYEIALPTLSDLNTANGNTFTITTQPSPNGTIPSKTRYINNLLVASIVGEPVLAEPEITFTTKVKTGTGLVTTAGTGYTNPTVAITGGGGSGATGTLTTKVVSATIDTAGTGGTPGAATVTGTTGTGTPFQAAVTIGAGGDITSVNSISVAGNYTVPPTIDGEPVTGGGLVGAKLDLSLGLLAFTITAAGTGFTSYPTYTITDATGVSGAVTASQTVESPMTIVDAGENLNTAPILTFSATSGTLATATTTLDANTQTISGTTLTVAGAYKKGTDTYPTLAISAGSGARILYDQKGTEFFPLQVEETVATVSTAINAL
jgi:hypothetical protein